MLSGIKRGKRKRKSDQNSETKKVEKQNAEQSAKLKSSSSEDNRQAAEELRRMLTGGDSISNTSAALSASTPKKNNLGDAIDRFEKRRGNLAGAHDTSSSHGDSSEKVIIVNLNIGSEAPAIQKEDFRNGARKGKVKSQGSYLHADEDKTVTEMVAEERRSQQEGSRSMDEVFARNVARLGSRYKGAEFQTVAGASAGADEDDVAGDGGIDMKMFTSNDNRLTGAARYNREVSRQIARESKAQSFTSRCWWWMESGSFQKHRLLSLGDHVSMVMIPSHLSLTSDHLFLVPVQHAESFASCENEVWNEVSHFKASLRRMLKKEGKGVLFCETVLPSKGFWQTRMDIIPVPKEVEQDAEMFFKSAMTEQAEEWGVHTKVLSTKGKGLRGTVPKGFPYFNVEWSDGGFAQIIENEKFPKDFGLDIIAGMMELDPMKFNRKPKASDHDRGAVLKFLNGWKEFDWTLSLDEGK
mmetsp:Transcript_182/g.338  ORF Transcript_182/g.338 Transcript_182/m.338 type:complete len:468 (+) Transcript_182:58-1461(+)